MQIEVNIGLKIGDEYSNDNLNKTLEYLKGVLASYRLCLSPTGEETLVGILNVEKHNLIRSIEILCVHLKQECIAIRYRPENSNYIGMLIYNPFGKNIIKEKFNKDLFVGFTDCAKLPDNMGHRMGYNMDDNLYNLSNE